MKILLRNDVLTESEKNHLNANRVRCSELMLELACGFYKRVINSKTVRSIFRKNISLFNKNEFPTQQYVLNGKISFRNTESDAQFLFEKNVTL